MADEWVCWVAVVGLPSATIQTQIGPGKSCLCNRFVRPHQDDYSESHPSAISNQDFGGSVINNDNFLYWGYSSRTIDNTPVGFKIIEHTQFYDDHNFKAFCDKAYDKRAMKPQVTTHGLKYKYIDYDHLADQESDPDLERFPNEKSEKVVVDCFIFVFDVSREDITFVNQYTLMEKFIKNASKPLIVALTKFDSFQCKHIETIRQMTTRNKIPVVEVSSLLNINVEATFHLAARLSKHKKAHIARTQSIPSYEEGEKAHVERRDEVSRLYNLLTEGTVNNAKVTWPEFRICCKNQPDFQNFCQMNGTRKARTLFERHRRNVIAKQTELRKNLYLKDLHSVFEHLIDSLDLSEYPTALQHIRAHPDFSLFFTAPEETETWKEAPLRNCPTTDRLLIPFDLLQEPAARSCFEQRIEVLRAEQEQVDLAEEFERALTTHTGGAEDDGGILPGQSLEEVLGVVGERFTKLEVERSRVIYENHQHLITKQFTREFGEMLLERTELFRAQLPGGDLCPDAMAHLSEALSADVRWSHLANLPDRREIMTLQHLAVFATGSRTQAPEQTSIERRFYSQILEKTLNRSELNYAVNLQVEGSLNVSLISADGTAESWVATIAERCPTLGQDEGAVTTVNVTHQHPSTAEIKGPVHLLIGFYRTDDWASFREVTQCYNRLLSKTGYRGIPCQLVYLPSDNPTVTLEEGSRFAQRLNCELMSEMELSDTLGELLTTTVHLLTTRRQFVERPSELPLRSLLHLSIRLFYDDDISIKDVTSSLFKYQFGFVHPYDTSVFILHTVLGGVPTFVMVHLLHYLDRESVNEHASLLLCKDSRKASLENARLCIAEYHDSKSVGVVLYQSGQPHAHLDTLLSTANKHSVPVVKVEREQQNRRVSVGQQATPVDSLLLSVLQTGVHFITDPTADISGDDISCSEDENSTLDLSVRSKDRRSNTLDPSRFGLFSPPPYATPRESLTDKFTGLSVSCTELRDDSHGSPASWNSMPRNIKGLTATPPIYSVVRRRGSMPSDQEDTPKSPPFQQRLHSETSSEGLDLNEKIPDSPFKGGKRHLGRTFKKKLTGEEQELKKAEKLRKKAQKEERKRKAKQKKLEKNKKLLESWDQKKQLAHLKAFKGPEYHKARESCYFGRHLGDIAPFGLVPYYVTLCVEFLECHDMTIEGLYRKEGNKLQINRLEETFEKAFSESGGNLSKFNLVELDFSVHVVASSVKNFFKRLPSPVVPHEFQDMLLGAKELDDVQVDMPSLGVLKVKEVLEKFPKEERLSLAYIIRHLSRVTMHQEQNKMTSENLAIIFWPTLLQPTEQVLMNNEDRIKFSSLLKFLIDNSDHLFGPELPSCPPPEEDSIYDMIFHPEIAKQRDLDAYDYIKRPKTYFNQALRIGHVPSLVKQCVNFMDNGKITANLYLQPAREDLVDSFVKAYEAAYTVDEHRALNFRKLLKNLSVTRSITDDSISTSTTDDNSVSSVSGDLLDRGLGGPGTGAAFEETIMDCTILATVLKRYLTNLLVPLIPPEAHDTFKEIAEAREEEVAGKIREAANSLRSPHQILLSYLMKHFSVMQDKGVLQIPVVFGPVIFYGSCLPATPPSPGTQVPLSYTPSMAVEERVVELLVRHVHVFALSDGGSLYAPLYESMEQDTASCHQYSSVTYTLPSLPEGEERVYESAGSYYAGPLYTPVSNVYEVEPRAVGGVPGGAVLYHEPQYAALDNDDDGDDDGLGEFYGEDEGTPRDMEIRG